MSNLKGHYIEWDTIGLCGLVGESGSGKTSTTRFLMAQMALNGTGMILIDGHGKMNTQTQTLAQSCEPLSSAYIVPAAITDDDIIAAIRLARKIAQDRIDGRDNSKSHVALIIDEFISVLGRMNKADFDFTVDTIVKFAGEYRKTGVKAFVSAFNWTQDMIGAATIRKSMNTKILHRVSANDVQLFSTLPYVKKTVPQMRVGEAFIIQANADPIKVYVPKVTADDLKAIKNRVLSWDGSYQETFLSVSSNVSAYESGISQVSHTLDQNVLLQKWCEEIRNCINNGMNKTDTIVMIWGVYPGSSKRYKTASKLYDYVKTKII